TSLDLRIAHDPAEERELEERVASVIPSHVYDELFDILCFDEPKESFGEIPEGLTGCVSHAIELEIDGTMLSQVLEPVGDMRIPQGGRQGASVHRLKGNPAFREGDGIP